MAAIDLNYIDYIVISIISISTIFGLFRGFIASILSFVGWIASIYLSYVFLPNSKEMLAEFITNPAISTAVGYSGFMIISLILFGILNFVISKAIGVFLMGGLFDKLLGGIFGTLRGIVIISGVYLCFVIALNMLNGKDSLMSEHKSSYPKSVTDAYTYKYIVASKESLVDILPQGIEDALEALTKKFSKVDDIASEVMDKELIESIDEDVLSEALPNEGNKNINNE